MKEKSIKLRLFNNTFLHLIICAISALTAVPLIAILVKVAVEGFKNFSGRFLFESSPNTFQVILAQQSGEGFPGGIANGIVGTLLMLIMASAISIPVGILSGVYLAEKKDCLWSKIVSYLTDILQGTPSIILGIIVYAWIVIPMKRYSAIAGSVTLFIMMLPLIVRSTEEALKMLPQSLKEASLSLGCGYGALVWKILIPSALSQIFTGILLAVSRIIGETAPLMFTALGCATLQWDVSRPMSSVPLLIWQFFNNPTMQPLVWSSSLFLLIFVLILNISSKIFSIKWKI